MNKDLYDKLEFKEKIMYDEFCDFTRKLCARIDVMTQVMQKLLDEATKEIE